MHTMDCDDVDAIAIGEVLPKCLRGSALGTNQDIRLEWLNNDVSLGGAPGQPRGAAPMLIPLLQSSQLRLQNTVVPPIISKPYGRDNPGGRGGSGSSRGVFSKWP